jgi:hypothetical protein
MHKVALAMLNGRVNQLKKQEETARQAVAYYQGSIDSDRETNRLNDIPMLEQKRNAAQHDLDEAVKELKSLIPSLSTLNEEVLAENMPVRPEPAHISEIDAEDLVGRLAINPHGVEFMVAELAFESASASVVIRLMNLEDGETVGLDSLPGWTICQQLAGTDLEEERMDP